MLSAELRGEAYSKAAHRRALLPRLDGRSEGAIERKHGNISAVLIALGYPYIEGYKPFANYQGLLYEVVSARMAESRELERTIAADVDAPPAQPEFDDILSALVDPPDRPRATTRSSPGRPPLPAGKHRRIDYLQREARNAALGAAGERFVLDYERARLVAAGHERLAGEIEHVARTRGDGEGFDILSFEESGRERLIEVKTTRYGAQTPFYVSANEVRVSEREADRYHLCRVFAFRKSPRLFEVAGAFSAGFDLDPTQYMARIA